MKTKLAFLILLCVLLGKSATAQNVVQVAGMSTCCPHLFVGSREAPI
ncbi:MAG: hypothetical protein WBD87_08835 [Candidatus Acidiferrales bacterium]